MSHVYNHRRNLPDHRDLVHFAPAATSRLPLKFDLWAEYPEIRRWDQSSEGSCGGHSAARAAQHELGKSGVTFTQNWTADDISPGDRVSPAFQYYAARLLMGTADQDSGVDNRSLFQGLRKYGSVREADMPYIPGQFAAPPTARAFQDATRWENVTYRQVVPTHGNLRATLVAGHAIVQAFAVPDYFEQPSIFDPATGYLELPHDVPSFSSYLGGHDVVITGYDYTRSTFPVPVFLIDNSWSDSWGQAFDAPSGRAGRFAMDARWQGNSQLVMDLTALISDQA